MSAMDTSQFGEDGIIRHIFEKIGTTNKWCIELGALNGTHHSNTRRLIAEEGWSAVLIEADPTYFEKLTEVYKDTPNAYPIQKFITFEGKDALDSVLAETPIPKDPDLFSLDIDGNEYHVWDSMHTYAPRVLVVEFNPSIPNEVTFIQPRDMRVFQGSSLRAIIALAKEKGYELAATNDTNGFFVRKDLFPKLGITDNSIETLRTDHQYETKLYQLYDGTLKISGFNKLFWHNIPIDEGKLQILPSAKRAYPARISDNTTVRSLKYLIRKSPLYAPLQKVRKSLGL